MLQNSVLLVEIISIKEDRKHVVVIFFFAANCTNYVILVLLHESLVEKM